MKKEKNAKKTNSFSEISLGTYKEAFELLKKGEKKI